jgi:hypothetical protein
MKVLPVFLKNNVPLEFFIANVESNKLILDHLVCKYPQTHDVSKCVLYVNDKPVNFIKSSWATPTTFNVNGIQGKVSSHLIEPLTKVTFKLVIDCKKEEEKKFEDVRFHLHLSLEVESKISIAETKIDLPEFDRSKAS